MNIKILGLLASLWLMLSVVWAEDEPVVPVEKEGLNQKVAIMAYHEPREPVYYDDMRRVLYERYSLRLLRFVHRVTGVALDGESSMLQTIGGVCIFIMTFCIFLGFIYKRKRLWFGLIAFGAFNVFAALIYMFSGVAALNQHDMKDPLNVQKLIDVLVVRGIPFDVYWDWGAFKETWDKSEGQAYHAIAWGGIPLGGDEIQIEEWLKDHRDSDLMHICLGAHLPAMFHPAVFQGLESELTWNADSSVSICDRASAYERHVSWREKGKAPVAGVFIGGGFEVLYLPSTLGAREMDRVWNEVVGRREGWVNCHLHWEGEVALRMDDPGTALAAHLESWLMATLNPKVWSEVESVLKKHDAVMSVGYVPAWLDDADTARGKLYVNGSELADRKAGQYYPSHQVRFLHHKLGWYELEKQAEFLRTSPWVETELHGLTHITPNVETWLQASNKDEDADWYREFLGTEVRPFVQRPREVQLNLLEESQSLHLQAFERSAKLLIPPGHAISWDTAEVCLEKGLWGLCGRTLMVGLDGIPRRTRLVDSYDLNVLTQQELKARSWDLPSVAMLHDRDIYRDGAAWLEQKLSDLPSQKFISVRELMARMKFSPDVFFDDAKGLLRLSFPPIDMSPIPERWQQSFRLVPPSGWKWKQWPEQFDPKLSLLRRKMSDGPGLMEFQLEKVL